MLELGFDELRTEEQRGQAMFDLAQRTVLLGRQNDERMIEHAKEILQELTNDRQIEALSNISAQSGTSGKAQGNSD